VDYRHYKNIVLGKATYSHAPTPRPAQPGSPEAKAAAGVQGQPAGNGLIDIDNIEIYNVTQEPDPESESDLAPGAERNAAKAADEQPQGEK
jgi:hypothetical protein